MEKKREISGKGSGCVEGRQSAVSSSSSPGLDIKLELVPGVEKISKLERASSKQQVKSGKLDTTCMEERDGRIRWKVPTLEYFNR